MANNIIKYEFVDSLPEELDEHKIYISMDFATAAHKCFCGCGMEVVTPMSPTDWRIIYDGVSVSFTPSIGNWSFPCKSHYWIVRNEVRWAKQLTPKQIAAGRAANLRAKQMYYEDFADPLLHSAKSVQKSHFKKFFIHIRSWF